MKTLILMTVLLTSCAGDRTRQEALLPAMQMAWPQVQYDYEYGVLDGLEADEINDTEWEMWVARGESLSVALGLGVTLDESVPSIETTPWDTMEPWAVRGIQAQLNDGELGANGAMIIVQRLHNFTAAMEIMQGKNLELIDGIWVPMCLRRNHPPHSVVEMGEDK